MGFIKREDNGPYLSEEMNNEWSENEKIIETED